MDTGRIFAFLSEGMARGERAALVTITAVTGSSMRSPGTHMAVLENGAFAGSLSGGCIEAAIVSEAIGAIHAGEAKTVTFGAGSPYLDIKLPCGGSIDVHFLPLGNTATAAQANAAFAARQPFALHIPASGGELTFDSQPPAAKITRAEDDLTIGHWPIPKILIIGHGAAVFSLATQSQALGAEIAVLTPDADLMQKLERAAITVQSLRTVSDVHLIESDPWTAIVFLFHDHDWEEQLLAHCLKQPRFYLGAMGGRTAHAGRIAALQEGGVDGEAIASIKAPIGLFHSSRNPDTLAVSVLAEIMKAHGEIEAARLCGTA